MTVIMTKMAMPIAMHEVDIECNNSYDDNDDCSDDNSNEDDNTNTNYIATLHYYSCILIYQGVHCCTKICNLHVLRTVRVVIQPESSGCYSCGYNHYRPFYHG